MASLGSSPMEQWNGLGDTAFEHHIPSEHTHKIHTLNTLNEFVTSHYEGARNNSPMW